MLLVLNLKAEIKLPARPLELSISSASPPEPDAEMTEAGRPCRSLVQ